MLRKENVKMSEELFRKKSLDKIKSPENLDDYIQVSNPGVWLLLVSVIVLLAGACIWGVFGHIDSTVDTSVHVENGAAVCRIAKENGTSVKEGMTVRFEGVESVISEIERDGQGYVGLLETDNTAPDGFYAGKILIKSVKPLSFVLN